MHIYETDSHKKVVSVTTILQILGSPELMKWANSLGFRHLSYESELNRTAVRGTKAHDMIQHLVDPSLPPKEFKFKDGFEKEWYDKLLHNFEVEMKDFPYETIFTEKSFASDKLKYGGTVDWYAKIRGKYVLLDFKTSKEVHLKHILQLGAYKKLLEEKGFQVDAGAIILINDKRCKLHPVSGKILEEAFKAFKGLVAAYPFCTLDTVPSTPELKEEWKGIP